MVTLINVSHIHPDSTGHILKRDTHIRGRRLTPGAQSTYDELPPEAEPLIWDKERNPNGILRAVYAGNVGPRDQVEVEEQSEEPGSVSDVDSEDTHASGESEVSPGDDSADESGDDSSDEPGDESSGDSDDGSADESSDESGDEVAPAVNVGSSLEQRLVGDAVAQIEKLETVEQVDAYVEGDHRPRVAKAAERKRSELDA